MLWTDFYDGFWDWSDSTRRSRISSLEDIGTGEEVVEVVLEIEDEKVRAQLIRKAMKFGVKFTSEDFMNLDGELSDELYEQLGQYSGYDHNDPYFDEDNMTWDDFYCSYSDWNNEVLLRRINKLTKFGPSDEVADTIQSMPTTEAENLLYKKAVAAGVRFTEEELQDIDGLLNVLKKAIDSMGAENAQHKTASATPSKNTAPPRSAIMGSEYIVVDVQLLNVEDRGSNVLVNYTQVFGNGSKKTLRKNVKDLGGYYSFFSPKPIVSAECLGKVYCGIIKSDVRLLFAVRLNDGSAQLIQTHEGSKESLKLLQLSEESAYEAAPTPPPSAKPSVSRPVEPYKLKKNELPQGSYVIGRDIPPGTYDFFVVYGQGGKFDIAKYDANGKIIDGTWDFFWVGLKEEYEHRELIHVRCQEGYTVSISGNVILKIAKSQQVQIDL